MATVLTYQTPNQYMGTRKTVRGGTRKLQGVPECDKTIFLQVYLIQCGRKGTTPKMYHVELNIINLCSLEVTTSLKRLLGSRTSLNY